MYETFVNLYTHIYLYIYLGNKHAYTYILYYEGQKKKPIVHQNFKNNSMKIH